MKAVDLFMIKMILKKKINSSEFYDWAVGTSTLLEALINIMKVTKSSLTNKICNQL